MMDFVLKDGTRFEVEDGSFLGHVIAHVVDYAEFVQLAASLTEENLSSIRIGNKTYTHVTLTEPNFKVTNIGQYLKVKIALRKLTEAEVKVSAAETAAIMLADEQALTVKDLYGVYDQNGVQYKTGDRKTYNGILYKCLQDHTSQPGWEPGIAPSLWVALESGSEAGTLEDPIPVPDTVTTSGMEYEYGKYYKEGDTVYLCQRGGVENPESMYGQTVTLSFPPSALIGQYFVAVEE